ncbi:MAG: glycine--tRNA ligase, partial [Planctomycetota bacterium]|nr:glycine--tRNA ligase [Planctomycetota bacterium]
MAKSTEKMEKIVALCKRRGFIFQSSEIYGGINGFWDYGPLGVELKRNIKDAWWLDMVRNPPPGPDGKEFQMVGLDAALIMNPKVWEASGHVGGFSDPMVDCKECKARFRADKVFLIEVFKKIEDDYLSDAKKLLEKDQTGKLTVSGPPIVVLSVEADSIRDAMDQAQTAITAVAKKRNIGAFKKCTVACGIEDNPLLLVSQSSGASFLGRIYPLGDPESDAGRPCPRCGTLDSLTEPRGFNLMFQTFVGASQDSSSVAYLRPETAQGIFANFKNVVDTSRVKLPFGIGQIGKAFRNEINPRNYTFRSREFEQMEIEFFCHDDDAMKWWEWWRDVRIKWYVDLGLRGDNLRPRNQEGDELAHYSKACTDIEYCFPFADEPQEL